MNRPARKGPVMFRLMVLVFSIVFGVLCYWLLGFFMNDIGTWPGPDFAEVENQRLDAGLVLSAQSLTKEIEETGRRIKDTQNRQQTLKDSIDNAKRTVDQLLEIQRLTLEKNSELSADEQTAMSQNIQLFLNNQQQYQAYNDEISRLNEQRIALEERLRENSQRLEVAREPIRKEFQKALERHNLKIAGLKLAVLVPLLLIMLALFLWKRTSIYTPLLYAAAIALAVKVMLVMHEHFPSRFFKYILILVLLSVVAWVLIYLLRMIAFPKREWLLKQYSDAYEAFLCPICSYPIRRGPLKYLSWTRRSIRKIATRSLTTEPGAVEETYTCPMCSTPLFETCSSCNGVRHSLLPACEKCGAVKRVVSESAESNADVTNQPTGEPA